MFKGLKWIAAIVPLVAVTFAMGAGRGNQIVGTAHDFTTVSWGGNNVCLPCHTPHNAMPNAVSGRLWNHALTTQTFTLNASNTSTLPGQPATMLDRVSQMCLGCHDGVTALDAFGHKRNETGGAPIVARASLGTDLSNDHPVGLFAIYDENRAHGGHYSYQDLATVTAAGLRLVDVPTAYRRVSGANVEVPNAKVISCVTCHNAHGAGIEYQGVKNRMFLRTTGDKICTSCHTK